MIFWQIVLVAVVLNDLYGALRKMIKFMALSFSLLTRVPVIWWLKFPFIDVFS